MNSIGQEIRRAFRRLKAQPSFSLIVVLTLGLGFGVNTAIFSLIRGVLISPLPFEQADRLVLVFNAFPQAGDVDLRVSPAEMSDLNAEDNLFNGVAGIRTGEQNALWTLEADGRTEKTEGAWVSANLFEVLGVNAMLGRTFTADEGIEGRHKVMVLSGDFWRARFAADPSIIGRTLRIRGVDLEVVGVMPPGFQTDLNVSGAQNVDYWIVDAEDPERSRQWWGFNAIARLSDGVTIKQAGSRLSAIADGFAEQFPDAYRSAAEYDLTVEPVRERVVGQAQAPLLVLWGSVAMVLLIACMNVANLLLVRAERTLHEVALRTALGASQRATALPFFVETGLLTLAGGATGLLVAFGSIAYVRRFNPGGIPRIADVHLDLMVLVVTGAIVVAVGLFMALLPALRARSVAPAEILKSGGRSASGGAGGRRTRQALVVGEVAIALVLTVGAGLLLQSFRNLTELDLGFQPESVASMRMDFPTWQYPDMDEVGRVQKAILERTSEVPGVFSTAMAHAEHPLRHNGQWYFAEEGSEDDPAATQSMVGIRVASPDYVETLGMTLFSGRTFDERDRAGGPSTILVNQALAEKRFPGENPIGRRLKIINAGGDMPPFEIIGVVGDVRNEGIREDTRETLILPLENPSFAQGWTRHMTLHARTDGDPREAAALLRASIAEVEPGLTVYDVRALSDVVSEASATPLFLSTLTGAFALLALLLAGLGTYGVVSYSVVGRTREIGVRMALGAWPGSIEHRIVSEGLRLGAVGIAIGVPASLFAVGTLSSILFGIAPVHVPTIVVVSMTLLGLVAGAAYLPARRAARIAPTTALRAE